jgi:biotin carboxylase
VEARSPPGGQRLLVLGAGPAQLGALAAARRRGLYVIAVDRSPGAPGFRFADRRAIFSTEDEATVALLARAERVDGLLSPGTDWPVGIAARVAANLGLPHPISPETAALAVSKARQRERFAEAGVPQARSLVCRTPDEARGAAKRIGFPCVLKPTDRQGQVGLSVVERAEDVGEAFLGARSEARGGAVLLEELVPGRELTVNAFSVADSFVPLTVTDRLTAERPAFGVALAHAWPSRLPNDDVEVAVGAARAACEAIGLEDGPSYTQVLAASDGPRVVEVAARLGGGHDAELCEAALGVDLNGLAISAALGEPSDTVLQAADWAPSYGSEAEPRGGSTASDTVSLAAPRAAGGCVRFLVAPEGKLVETRGEDEARQVDGVLDVLLYRSPGYRFGPLRRGGDRAGAVIAVGDSRDDALARADRAAQRIRFDTAEVADVEAFV